MNRDRIRAVVIESLAQIAPEADPSGLDRSASSREVLDIDSMDFLRFVSALHAALGVDVPEREYSRVDSLDGAVSDLAQRLDASS